MVLAKKVIRTMLQNKVQYAGALIMVVINAMLFVGMNLVSINLDHLFQNFAAENKLEDAQIFTASDFEIAKMSSILNASIEKNNMIDYELNPGQTLRIFSEGEFLNIPAVMQGSKLQGNDILIDSLFANANQIEIGDSLTIQEKEYRVSGFMVLPNYIYIIRTKEEMINDPTAFGIAVMSKEDMQAFTGISAFYSIRFDSRENIHQQEIDAKNLFRDEGIEIRSWDSTSSNVKVSYVETEVITLTTMSRVVPISMMILTSVLIAIIIKRMVNRDSMILGTLYAQGYRRRELLGHYLLYPLAIAGIGGLVGAVLGVCMVEPMLNFLLSVFTMPFSDVLFNFSYPFFALLIPGLILCVTTFFVVNKTLKMQPAELMSGIKNSGQINFLEKALNLDRLGFNTKFQIREQVRSLSRLVFLLFGVIVATILLLYGLTLQSSLDFMLTKGIQSLYNLKYEYVYYDLKTSTPPQGTETFNAMYATLADNNDENFIVVGLAPNSERIILNDMKGNRIYPTQVVITRQMAEKLDVNAGDEILVTDDDTSKSYTITIDVIANSYAGEFVFMPLETLNGMLGVPANAYIGIWSDNQINFEEGTIKSTKSMAAIIDAINNLISQTGVMVYTLTISAFAIGLVIIFIVTGMIIDENKITISLLKVFGYRKKEINRLVLDSNILVVILGYLLGIPILIVSVRALMQSLTESMQLTIPVHLNAIYMLFGLLVVLFTFQVSKWFNKKKVNQVPMSEALKAGTE